MEQVAEHGVRVAAEGHAPSYVEHWRAANRRLLTSVGVWLAWIPVATLGPLMTSDHRIPAWFVYGYLFVFAWAGVRAALLRCPRCGRLFGIKGIRGIGPATKCLHCGLPRNARTDPDWHPPPSV